MALAALAFAGGAQAQDAGSVSDYRLPPKPSPAPPPVEGPVDPDHPVAAPARPAPQPPASTATPAPRIVLPPLPPREARRPPQAEQEQRPRAAPERPAPAPSASTAPQAPVTPPAPFAEPSAPAPAAPAPPPTAGRDWLLLGGLAALLLAGVGVFLWRRRKAQAAAPAAEPQPAAPAPSAPAALTPVGAPIARPPAAPAPGEAPFALHFEPQTLRLSLVYATLAYRITLANRGHAALGRLRVAGDMISAHAALPSAQQLAVSGEGIEAQHEVAALGAGDSVSLGGELRLPLEAVRPLQAGAAQLFLPLARFLIEAAGDGQRTFSDTRIFSVGRPNPQANGAMMPFRLDLGPQLFREVDRREVDVARWLPVDEARRFG